MIPHYFSNVEVWQAKPRLKMFNVGFFVMYAFNVLAVCFGSLSWQKWSCCQSWQIFPDGIAWIKICIHDSIILTRSWTPLNWNGAPNHDNLCRVLQKAVSTVVPFSLPPLNTLKTVWTQNVHIRIHPSVKPVATDLRSCVICDASAFSFSSLRKICWQPPFH